MIDDAESAVLDWQGPLDLARYAAPEDAAPLQVPAAYLCVATYETQTGVYVGMSKNFLDRVRSHVAATMGLTYGLRDDQGEWRYEPKPAPGYFEQFASPEALAETVAMATAEVRRQRWYFAEVDSQGLPYVEGLLIRHLRDLVAAGAEIEGRRAVCDNGNAGRAPIGPLVLNNDGADLPCDLLGPAVRWPLAVAA